MNIALVLRWPGSKWTLAQWIIDQMPPHVHYLEPFFGSGAVFFCKQPSKFETINDLDSDVTNLFRVIRTRKDELAANNRYVIPTSSIHSSLERRCSEAC